jgi:hypothetical protein
MRKGATKATPSRARVQQCLTRINILSSTKVLKSVHIFEGKNDATDTKIQTSQLFSLFDFTSDQLKLVFYKLSCNVVISSI